MKSFVRTAPFLGVAALAALAIHQLAYTSVALVAELLPASALDHSHVGAQWMVLTPVAVLAGIALVLRQVRASGYRPCSPRAMALASGLLFVAQEAMEGAAAGSIARGVFTAPLLVGLLLSPLVAAVVTRLLSEVADALARFVALVAPMRPRVAKFARPSGTAVRAQLVVALAPSRGPPVLMR